VIKNDKVRTLQYYNIALKKGWSKMSDFISWGLYISSKWDDFFKI